MIGDITRDCSEPPVTLLIESGHAVSIDVLDFRNWAGALVEVDGWTPGDLGFLVCDTPDGIFEPLKDEDSNYVEILNFDAVNARVVPARVFPSHFVKVWSMWKGMDIIQGGDRTLTFQLKG